MFPPDPEVRAHLRSVARALGSERGRSPIVDRLARYAERGSFPRPAGPVAVRLRTVAPPRAFRGSGERMPLFRDANGVFCAVGHLYAEDEPVAAAALAARVADGFLPETHDPGLLTWAARHGLSADDLAWIQPSYCWEPPVCADTEIAPSEIDTYGACEGADPRIGTLTFCQDCDGPFHVTVWMQNPGNADAIDVRVDLWGPEGVRDTEVIARIEDGTQVRVDLETASVLDVGAGGGLSVSAANACREPYDYTRWDTGNGGPGWIWPAACGGEGCYTDTGIPESETPVDPAEPPPSRGCTTTGVGAGAIGVFATLGLRRRRIHR